MRVKVLRSTRNSAAVPPGVVGRRNGTQISGREATEHWQQGHAADARPPGASDVAAAADHASNGIGQDSGRVLTGTLGEYLTGGDPLILISD